MAKKNEETNVPTYDAGDIQVLKGLEHVRKRPAMYIGDISSRGLHHLVYEVIDNAIDEALAGYCDKITLTINKNGSITVTDNGRGIPTEVHPTEKISALEVVMTQLNAGGKFNRDSYKVSGGLHGVGVSVVNALSEYLEAEVVRDGKVYYQKYKRGAPEGKVKVIGAAKKTGTKITFYPDNEIFKNIIFKYETLEERLRELAYLNKDLTIIIKDEREEGKNAEFHFKGGLVDFVKYLDESEKSISGKPIFISGERENV
ncbi:MAG: ATP-binding protein, partial [bacterium]